MFLNLNFLDYVIILSGVFLCLKKVAEMERYHELRVIALSLLLCFAVGIVFLFLVYTFTFGGSSDCVINFSESEM